MTHSDSADAQNVLLAAVDGGLSALPTACVHAAGAITQHHDAIDIGDLLERIAEASERIANALESRGGI